MNILELGKVVVVGILGNNLMQRGTKYNRLEANSSPIADPSVKAVSFKRNKTMKQNKLDQLKWVNNKRSIAGKWVAKNDITIDDLMRGTNINTKQELTDGRILYSKYLIHKVMPKTIDETTITHIDYGTEKAYRSYRSDKDMLVRLINSETIVNVYLPKENKS